MIVSSVFIFASQCKEINGHWRVMYPIDDVELHLGCSRAIGDNHYNQDGDIVSAVPEIREFQLKVGQRYPPCFCSLLACPPLMISVCVSSGAQDEEGEEDQFMLLACDGLWDVFSTQEAVSEVRHQGIQAKSKIIFELKRLILYPPPNICIHHRPPRCCAR